MGMKVEFDKTKHELQRILMEEGTPFAANMFADLEPGWCERLKAAKRVGPSTASLTSRALLASTTSIESPRVAALATKARKAVQGQAWRTSMLSASSSLAATTIYTAGSLVTSGGSLKGATPTSPSSTCKK